MQQPWAECIARGVKLVENRSRPTTHRGPMAIHAGARTSARGLADPRVLAELAPLRDVDLWPGAVLAVVDLVDCHPAAGCCRPWGDDQYRGRPVHHLVLDNVRPRKRVSA